ncbi:hypothetical protein NZD89_14570 [Alicyclobacillus fastidiosus]|uniref:WXG100 family type VII secretion target n=1 Tax=Alicyclobacillus fastidiosus TaxID=392011 RepID=A0ABY6Z9U2_9BACL|nr:hypothetical protein [Alicyclobacillus fastidiosus]WAH39642.1 hypothetical protein NZD89_14570 [Alicyclobacillus fastidiosus]GMA60851.1 hypothetical protein GCM10025859_12910 [Alicyclobacillus fastidiosus]
MSITNDGRVLTNAEIDFWESKQLSGLQKHLIATIRDLQAQLLELEQGHDKWNRRLQHYRSTAVDIHEIADQLQIQCDEYKAALERYNESADRFIHKVNLGLAKSTETYNDLFDARAQARQTLAKYERKGAPE